MRARDVLLLAAGAACAAMALRCTSQGDHAAAGASGAAGAQAGGASSSQGGSSGNAGAEASSGWPTKLAGITQTFAFPPSGQATVDATLPAPTSCGPGCTLPLGDHVGHYFFMGNSSFGVADIRRDNPSILYVDASGKTGAWSTAVDGQGLVQIYLHGSSASYVRSAYPLASLEVMDLTSGAYRSYFQWNLSSAGTNVTVTQTALNDAYVFANLDSAGIFKFDRISGAASRLVAGLYGCGSLCARPDGLVCLDGDLMFFDIDSGAMSLLSPTKAAQYNGACSLSREQYLWTDYRDSPPDYGIASVNGGDIYMYDFPTKTTTRLSFDSPANNVPKSLPARDGNVVVWKEFASTETYPPLTDTVSLATGSLVYLDLATGKRCKYNREWKTSPFGGPLSVIGRQVFSYFQDDQGGGYVYISRTDLDDPAIPWVCQ